MKSLPGILVLILVVSYFILGLWLGAGIGIAVCANYPEGYNNGYFGLKIKAYCRIEGEK